MHETYTWLLVGVLGYMILVLAFFTVGSSGFRFVRGFAGVIRSKKGGVEAEAMGSATLPPPMSFTGYMYYLCDSAMLRDFGGGLDDVSCCKG